MQVIVCEPRYLIFQTQSLMYSRTLQHLLLFIFHFIWMVLSVTRRDTSLISSSSNWFWDRVLYLEKSARPDMRTGCRRAWPIYLLKYGYSPLQFIKRTLQNIIGGQKCGKRPTKWRNRLSESWSIFSLWKYIESVLILLFMYPVVWQSDKSWSCLSFKIRAEPSSPTPAWQNSCLC